MEYWWVLNWKPLNQQELDEERRSVAEAEDLMAASLVKGEHVAKKLGENLAVTRAQSVTKVVRLVKERENK